MWTLAIVFLLTKILINPVFAKSTEQVSAASAAMTVAGLETGIKTTVVSGTITDRIFGEDRDQTAVAVSQKGWKASDYAVLALGGVEGITPPMLYVVDR
ncbi:MAG: hypothetical protein WCR27_01330 [Eubacteriales bacterium]